MIVLPHINSSWIRYNKIKTKVDAAIGNMCQFLLGTVQRENPGELNLENPDIQSVNSS